MDSAKYSSKLQELLREGRYNQFRKGQVLEPSGDSVKLSLINSGFVKRYLISNEGNLSVQSIYGPGDIFPLTPVFKLLLDQEIYLGPETYYYETISDAEIYSIDDDTLLQAVQTDPLLYHDLFSVAGRRLQSNIRGLENMSLHTSYDRVAHLLATYAHEYGVKVASGTRIDMPLTHLLLASILSITRETVSQSIIQLRERKLIKTGKFIVVTDLELLEKEAYKL